jgi:hypothetical protein
MKCGFQLEPGASICKNCGEQISSVNGVNINPINQPINNSYQQPDQKPDLLGSTYNYNVPVKKSKNIINSKIFYIIILIIVIILIGCGIFFFKLVNTSKLICESDKGSITIMFTNKDIVNFKTQGIEYNINEHKEAVKTFGIDTYIKSYNNIFKKDTNGKCTVKGSNIKLD